MIGFIAIAVCVASYVVLDHYLITVPYRRLKSLEKKDRTPRYSRYMPLHLERMDQRDETSVGKQFKQQEVRMNHERFVPHEAGCDIFSCKKEVCFVRKPDSIIRKFSVRLRKSGDRTIVNRRPEIELHKMRLTWKVTKKEVI